MTIDLPHVKTYVTDQRDPSDTVNVTDNWIVGWKGDPSSWLKIFKPASGTRTNNRLIAA